MLSVKIIDNLVFLIRFCLWQSLPNYVNLKGKWIKVQGPD